MGIKPSTWNKRSRVTALVMGGAAVALIATSLLAVSARANADLARPPSSGVGAKLVDVIVK